MVYNLRTKTYNDLNRKVKRIFGDESGVQLEEEDIRTWSNDGLLEIVSKLKPLKARSVATLAAGVDKLAFPDMRIMQVEAIHLDGSPLPTMPFQEAENTILQADPQRTSKGRPEFWYSWDDEFFLYPTPVNDHVIELYYSRYAMPLSGSLNEIIDLPDKLYNSLVDYVVQKAYEMDEDWSAAQMKEGSFNNAMMERSEEEYQLSHMNFPSIRNTDGY